MGCAPSTRRVRVASGDVGQQQVAHQQDKDEPCLSNEIIQILPDSTAPSPRTSTTESEQEQQQQESLLPTSPPSDSASSSAWRAKSSKSSATQVAPIHSKKAGRGSASSGSTGTGTNTNSIAGTDTRSQQGPEEPEQAPGLFHFGDFQVSQVDELMSKGDVTAMNWESVRKQMQIERIRKAMGYHMLRRVTPRSIGCGVANKVKTIDLTSNLLVSCSADDHGAAVYEYKYGVEIGRLIGGCNAVTQVCTSEGGQLIATGSRGGAVIVWDPVSLRRIWRLPHEHAITALAFSPDSTYLCVCTQDRVGRVWAMKTGRLVRMIQAHRGIVLSAKIATSPYRLVSGSADRTVNIQLLSEATPSVCFTHHANPVNSVDFLPVDTFAESPAGSTLVDDEGAGGRNDTRKPPDLDEFEKDIIGTPTRKSFYILSCDAQCIMLWHSATKEIRYIFDIQSLLAPSSELVRCVHIACIGALLAPPPFDSYVIIVTNTKLLWLVHLEDKEPPIPVMLRAAATCLCRRGDRIAVGDFFGNLYQIDLE